METNKKYTQIEKIILTMFLNPDKTWWIAQDFMPPAVSKDDPLHVGYEATARLSDLLNKYNPEDMELPPVFATERQNKFRAVRVRWEDFEQSLKNHPELIALAECTPIMSRFIGLRDKLATYRPEPKPEKQVFKSYANL